MALTIRGKRKRMAKAALAAPATKIAFSVQRCSFFASYEMTCPLCRVTVPPKTPHECSLPARQEKR